MRWRREQHDVPSIAVNVSAQQVMTESFTRTVRDVLTDTGINRQDLKLEVTEILFLSEPDRALRVMKELKNLGVRLSLDDFGTGYSSLSYLRLYPVDQVKLDRSFISNMISDDVTRSIVQAVIQLSHAINLEVIAEGVETPAELGLISALGADHAQG